MDEGAPTWVPPLHAQRVEWWDVPAGGQTDGFLWWHRGGPISWPEPQEDGTLAVRQAPGGWVDYLFDIADVRRTGEIIAFSGEHVLVRPDTWGPLVAARVECFRPLKE